MVHPASNGLVRRQWHSPLPHAAAVHRKLPWLLWRNSPWLHPTIWQHFLHSTRNLSSFGPIFQGPHHPTFSATGKMGKQSPPPESRTNTARIESRPTPVVAGPLHHTSSLRRPMQSITQISAADLPAPAPPHQHPCSAAPPPAHIVDNRCLRTRVLLRQDDAGEAQSRFPQHYPSSFQFTRCGQKCRNRLIHTPTVCAPYLSPSCAARTFVIL